MYEVRAYFVCMHMLIITFIFQLNSQEVLPSAIFWTSRSHRCHPFSPPVCALLFFVSRKGSAFPLLVDSIFLLLLITHALALSVIVVIFLCSEKSRRERMLSVRLEPTKMILIGTDTFQAIGGVFNYEHFKNCNHSWRGAYHFKIVQDKN